MATTQNVSKWVEEYDVVYGEDTEEQKSSSEFGKFLTSQEGKNFVEGEIFIGTIVKMTDDFVTVDIGYKQEGLVFAREFKNYDGTFKVKEGEEVEVYLEKLESSLGNLVLSRDKAEIFRAWDKISEASDQGSCVKGTVISKVKGGLSVDIGVKAFLPGSQIDVRPTRNLDKFIGQTMDFKVIKFNKKRGNIVLSRRTILQEERDKMRGETLGQIREGMIVKGVVKNITDYGAFIDLGGVDGLLHITDMSWGRVKHPNNLLTVGEEIEVKILKFDEDRERVSLGLKQVRPNPWEEAKEHYVVGSQLEGEVVSVKDYGVFLELDDGIEGLIHVSEMTWSNRPKRPSLCISVGEKIKAQVLDVDVEAKRISLGIKQLQPNPWDSIEKKFPMGTKVKGEIKSVVDFGIFVDLGEEVDALIHVSDISWTRKNVMPKNEFEEGQEIEALVLSVDKENQRFCLGIKQLEEDPWKNIEQRFPVGTMVSGPVVRVTDFGAFMELETGIEGFIHISELSEERVEKISDVIKKGDSPEAMVISIDKEAQKITLSVKSAQDGEGGEAVGDRSQSQEEVKAATLGDKLKNLIKIGRE
ncbi:MAG: 30S ribosomal protein S1 [Bacteriovoracales bacterium]|nr:30S ribosomal protein S1 [Bacteriovoracales bacterium]